MSDNNTPQTPDYAPYLTAFNDIASAAKSQGEESLAWARDQIANNKDLLDQVNKGLLDTQSTFSDAAKGALQQAGDTINTGLGNLYDEYDNLTDPERRASAIGAAEAQAAQANDAARKSSMAELESYGLNPGSVRYAGLDAGIRLQDAANRVSAGNVAARADQERVDARGAAINDRILNVGTTLAGRANANAATSAGAGTGAVGGANTTANTGGGLLGTGLQWTGAGTNATKGAVDTTNTGFTNELEVHKAEAKNSSGLGSLLGLGASMLGKGGAFASGGALAFLEEGGAIDDIGAGPAGGGSVPVEMSPSGGAAVDDVDAVSPGGPAKLNAGEFVIPDDATSWYGEKFFQNLIQKARKEKMGAQAKPQTSEGPQASGPQASGPEASDPAFQPRPQASQGALPV